MNKVILSGRLTADPKIGDGIKYAKYSLAVDRRFHKDDEPTADFFNCVAFGKSAEFAYKYLHKGMKIIVEGRLQTGSYEKNGVRIPTTDVVIDNQEFGESKNAQSTPQAEPQNTMPDFMNIPDNISEELPFS